MCVEVCDSSRGPLGLFQSCCVIMLSAPCTDVWRVACRALLRSLAYVLLVIAYQAAVPFFVWLLLSRQMPEQQRQGGP